MSGTVDHYRLAGYRNPTNTGDIRGCLSSFGANADRGGVVGHTFAANVDFVFAGCEIEPSRIAQSDVEAAGGVAVKRIITASRVVVAGCIQKERRGTIGRVERASRIINQCIKTNGCVVVAAVVGLE